MLNFTLREPIGSSTFPMPDQRFEEGAFRRAMSRKTAQKPTATIYIHIPFCDEICSFCGFNKMVSPEDLKEAYVEALVKEIWAYSGTAFIQSVEVDAVYIGGGTPNALRPDQSYRILDAVRRAFRLTAGCEVTTEGTPQNFTPEHIAAYQAGGVNRVSTGIQTFNADIRREHLNMKNGREELLASIAAIKAGFDTFNLDMIYNLPKQTPEIWQDDLETAIAAGSTHLTCYPLVLLERTILYREYVRKHGHPAPEQTEEIALFEHSVQRLAASRFTNQYSVRDWAEPGHACRYIELNARANHVVAFGAGAHGYMAGITYRNIAAPRRYVDAVESGRLPVEALRVATPDEIMQRFMVMGLRLKTFDTRPFAETFGKTVAEVYGDKLSALVEAGYITFEDDVIAYTAKGDIWANNVRTYFEGTKNRAVGYTDTLGAGETGKDHYSSISRVKASADIEAF